MTKGQGPNRLCTGGPPPPPPTKGSRQNERHSGAAAPTLALFINVPEPRGFGEAASLPGISHTLLTATMPRDREPKAEAAWSSSAPEKAEMYSSDHRGPPESKAAYYRNLAAFWLFGLCNNFAYVIMLSAAEDILTQQSGGNTTNATNADLPCNSNSTTRQCNKLSTGAVLLADILPTLIVKLTAPFYMELIPYGFRNGVVVAFQALSYLIVAFSGSVGVSLFGVVCASFGSGLGEIMFLSMSSHFSPNVISTWSSGTGGAGILGSIAYAGIIQMGVSPRNTVLIMLIVPALMAATYWVLMVIPESVYQVGLAPSTWIVPREHRNEVAPAENSALTATPQEERNGQLSMNEKFALVLPLLKFMVPLSLVYIGEYFINQGLQELIIFRCSGLDRKSQYRWYQVLYQVGVFVSRSSVNIVHFTGKLLPLLAILQLANAALFFTEAMYLYIPSIYIVLALIFYEGLLGGAVYVNTFYNIREEVAPEHVEFSLGVASVADTFGIVIAGFSSIPIHNWLCDRPLSPSRHIY